MKTYPFSRVDPTPDDTWAYANTQSILAVPESILPAGPAREELLTLARAGQDCYAYSPIQLEQDPEKRRYNVWIDGRRHTIEEWLAAYASREESRS